ncbi:MAG: hypothetical protein HFJ32_03205 [Clostridia bacterium]|nr:hypothetical protein [Clostridia bacterium]
MNSDKQVAVYDNEVSARDYISYIAEQAGGFASIGRDGKLYIKTIGEDIAELPLKYFQDFTWGELFKISRVQYEDGVQLFEKGDTTANTVYISQDNMYIVDQEQIDNIYEELDNLELYSFEGGSIIDPALDVGDILEIDGKKVIYQGSSEYKGKFKANISSKIQGKEKEETTTRTASQKAINRRVQSKIDQEEQRITQLVQETAENEQKLTKHEQDISSITNTVNNISVELNETNENVDNIEKTIVENTAQQEIRDNEIVTLVSETESRMTEEQDVIKQEQSTIQTKLIQTKNDYTYLFNTLLETINSNDDETNEKLVEISKYIRFVDGNIVLGESGNELTLTIENDKITFSQNEKEVAYFSNNQLYVTNAEILERLRLGNFAFIPRTNGNLSFKKEVS